MQGQLKVSSEKLMSTASEFQNQGNTIRSLTQQMLQIVSSLSGSWEGDAQMAYQRQFKALDGDMAQIQLKINKHVSDLNEMADTYQWVENTNTENISVLSSDYISG